MKKILVTGSNGMLGQTIVNKLLENNTYSIIAVSSGENKNIGKYKYFSIDISQKEEMKIFLETEKPDFIVNSAAITNVDLCEKEKELCYNVNSYSLNTITDFCKKNNTYLVHISTDFVFDGEKENPYSEEDNVNPLNEYGKSKLLAEKIIIDSHISSSILRTSQVYGFIKNFPRLNIITWIKKNMEEGNSINVFNDQYRMPTLVDDLADVIIFCIENKKTGIYNICGSEYICIVDLAIKIADYFDLDKKLINSVKTSDVKLLAKRPLKTNMSLEKSRIELNYNPKDIMQGLNIYKALL